MADKPYYPGSSVAHISTLAAMLEINRDLIEKHSKNTSSSYTTFLISPPSKKSREVSEPKESLKKIQKRINSRIMSEVDYPKYLMGGIRDTASRRDYVNNSKLHLKPETLINLDIENFFPNIHKEHVKNVFKYLFRFSEDVSETLSCLTTLEGVVPQGGCTSTYLGNLVFFNYEYGVVSKLRSKGISYSRLLDDITLSSKKRLTEEEKTWAISLVAGMINHYGMNMHDGKTRIEHRESRDAKYEVTGAWVRHGEPKIRKDDRKKIRSAVRKCEIMYEESPYSSEYHKQWNKTSGRVAQLGRFNHKTEEKKLRERLKTILPLYDDVYSKTLSVKVNQVVRRRRKNQINIDSVGTRNYILKLYHELGIMARTKKTQARKLKQSLRENFGNIISNPHY